MTDRPNAADYGDAFLDVAREWETLGPVPDAGQGGNRLHTSFANYFVEAVTARAAQYAERPADDSLDAAWAEAEAALPDGWDMGITRTTDPVDFDAWAGYTPEDDDSRDSWVHRDETGATPAAALRALAAALLAAITVPG